MTQMKSGATQIFANVFYITPYDRYQAENTYKPPQKYAITT